jgi:flagellar M-ring protein FliF
VNRVNVVLDRAKSVMAGFTSGQRTVVVVVGIALLMGAFALTRWMSNPSYTLLYGNLSGTDASAIVDQLTAGGVPYQLGSGGSTILVPADQVDGLRIQLSGKGIQPGSTDTGWSILDKQGITATDFQQNVAYRRALEGELGKTLEAMTGVNTAVVHLAIPQKDVFSTEADKTTASVLLSLAPGTDLTTDQISAITQLVGGSVEGLDPDQVTVTDQSGTLLSDTAGGGGGSTAGAGAADERTAAFEGRMDSKVQKLLDAVVGPGNSTVKVNAELDFNDTKTTSKVYTVPTPSAPSLSEATVKEQYGGGTGTANGGTLGQIIPTPAASVAAGSGGYLREQRTANAALNEVLQEQTTAPGQVKRMTVAVVLDSKTAGALPPAQIQQLVANAVGINPARGDTVQVDALPFDETAAAAAKAEIAAADKAAKMTGYLDLGKKAGLGLLVLVMLIMLMRGRKKNPVIEATASDLPAPPLMASTPMALEAGENQLALAASAAAAGQEKMRDEVAALIDSQPEDVAQMLQGWLAAGK